MKLTDVMWVVQSEESTMAETAAPEASPAPAIQIAPGTLI